MEVIFLLIIAFLLWLTNFVAFRVAGKNRIKRLWAGVIILLCTPFVFFATGMAISPFDPGGFGTGLLMVIYSFLSAVNGLIVIAIGLWPPKVTQHKQ